MHFYMFLLSLYMKSYLHFLRLFQVKMLVLFTDKVFLDFFLVVFFSLIYFLGRPMITLCTVVRWYHECSSSFLGYCQIGPIFYHCNHFSILITVIYSRLLN